MEVLRLLTADRVLYGMDHVCRSGAVRLDVLRKATAEHDSRRRSNDANLKKLSFADGTAHLSHSAQ